MPFHVNIYNFYICMKQIVAWIATAYHRNVPTASRLMPYCSIFVSVLFQVLSSVLVVGCQNLLVLNPEYSSILGQYHACWSLGSYRPHIISNHGVRYTGKTTPCLLRESISTACAISIFRNDKIMRLHFGAFLRFMRIAFKQHWL